MDEAAPRPLVVVSWNIQKGIGVDLRRDLGRTASVLARLDADVIGLQEVLRRAGDDHAEKLAHALSMQLAWGRARDVSDGEYGNALLVRGTASPVAVHDLAIGRRERRVCLEVMATPTGRPALRVFVCHFGLGFSERAQQATRLEAILAPSRHEHGRVVMGDFNEWHDGPVRKLLARTFPHLPPTRPTHPSPLPMFSLDRLAWDETLEGEVTVEKVSGASDHRALRARLSQRGRAA